MYSELLVCALAAVPLVAGHGKIIQVTGDQGGNGTALGITGAIVPGAGPNYLTEVDTTVFWSHEINTDQDIGYTQEAGNNELDDIAQTMELSGDVLPQISGSGGSVKTTYHIVTQDGAGPVQALIDETATGQWSTAKAVTVTTQVPGSEGFIALPSNSSLFRRGEDGNVNENFVSAHTHEYATQQCPNALLVFSPSNSICQTLIARDRKAARTTSASSKSLTITLMVHSAACFSFNRLMPAARRLVPSRVTGLSRLKPRFDLRSHDMLYFMWIAGHWECN